MLETPFAPADDMLESHGPPEVERVLQGKQLTLGGVRC
jgi:hypothetical protein